MHRSSAMVDPDTGVMRHAYAGYEIAAECAKEQGLKLPMVWVLDVVAFDRRVIGACSRCIPSSTGTFVIYTVKASLSNSVTNLLRGVLQ